MNPQQIIDYLSSQLNSLSDREVQQVLKSEASLRDFAEDNGLKGLAPGIIIIIFKALRALFGLL
jgi:hypothetical protein